MYCLTCYDLNMILGGEFPIFLGFDRLTLSGGRENIFWGDVGVGVLGIG